MKLYSVHATRYVGVYTIRSRVSVWLAYLGFAQHLSEYVAAKTMRLGHRGLGGVQLHSV